MPRYEYRCSHCGSDSTLRRPIDEMDDPIDSLCCGAPMNRRFAPTNNIFVPIAFRQVLTGGSVGGGQYGWSDFHDVSERELAHLKDENGQAVELEPANRALSRPGAGVSKENRRRAKESAAAEKVEGAFVEAKRRLAAQGVT